MPRGADLLIPEVEVQILAANLERILRRIIEGLCGDLPGKISTFSCNGIIVEPGVTGEPPCVHLIINNNATGGSLECRVKQDRPFLQQAPICLSTTEEGAGWAEVRWWIARKDLRGEQTRAYLLVGVEGVDESSSMPKVSKGFNGWMFLPKNGKSMTKPEEIALFLANATVKVRNGSFPNFNPEEALANAYGLSTFTD